MVGQKVVAPQGCSLPSEHPASSVPSSHGLSRSECLPAVWVQERHRSQCGKKGRSKGLEAGETGRLKTTSGSAWDLPKSSTTTLRETVTLGSSEQRRVVSLWGPAGKQTTEGRREAGRVARRGEGGLGGPDESGQHGRSVTFRRFCSRRGH